MGAAQVQVRQVLAGGGDRGLVDAAQIVGELRPQRPTPSASWVGHCVATSSVTAVLRPRRAIESRWVAASGSCSTSSASSSTEMTLAVDSVEQQSSNNHALHRFAMVDNPSRGFTPYEVRLTEAVGRVVGTVIEGIDSRGDLERQRDQAVAALDRAGTAVVITDPAAPGPRLNPAARFLLGEVVDAEHGLHWVIARPGTDGDFSRHLDVELTDGSTGLLHGHSTYVHAKGSTLITVLELQRDRSEISAETLMALTPREREVAQLVVDGFSDRQIAERLWLSHHTVSQYVKRIYRKLDVPSRVALTRLLLDLRGASRRD
jgi:DNA-binding NarL/FixJ family response regulator